MENIRVNKGVDVCVNDAGETIHISTEDRGIIKKYNDLIERIKGIQNGIDSVEDVNGYLYGETIEICKLIDVIFGDRASEKIFGKDVVPSLYAIYDFFLKVAPIINKAVAERNAKIHAIYSPNRTGGK